MKKLENVDRKNGKEQRKGKSSMRGLGYIYTHTPGDSAGGKWVGSRKGVEGVREEKRINRPVKVSRGRGERVNGGRETASGGCCRHRYCSVSV